MAKHVRGMSAGHENESGDNHVTPKLPQKVNRSITWRELCYFIAIGCKMLHGLLYNDEAETPSAVEMTWRWESAIATLAIPGIAGFVLNKKLKGRVNAILVRNLFFCGILLVTCLLTMMIREFLWAGAQDNDSMAPITISTFSQYGLILAGTFGFSLFFFSSLY